MALRAESPSIAPNRPDEERHLRAIALRRIKRRRAFIGHLAVYLAVNALLWSIWIVNGVANGFGFPWPVLPTVFWGLFVLVQGLTVHRPRHISEEEVERELKQLRAKRPGLEEHGPSEDDWPFERE